MPDSNNDQPVSDVSLSLAVACPTFTPRTRIPAELAALGREVLELVPRKPQPSLEAYRVAAHNLSRVLKATGVRVTPKVFYYTALRVKWLDQAVRLP
jgi:hypothetical protein